MIRFKKYAPFLAIIFIMIALMVYAEVRINKPAGIWNGIVTDKFEGENGHYILLDTNYWVKVTAEDYIGLDVGDFYEDN